VPPVRRGLSRKPSIYQENGINDRPDPGLRTTEPETPTPVERWRRRLPDALLNAAAVVSTALVVVAMDPKSPPFRGD
jgi:hypothetical protein